jgi:hypothetical protein
MSKFHVMCSETVWYCVEVEADTAEHAEELVANGEIDLGEPVDGDNFQIDEVVAQETV